MSKFFRVVPVFLVIATSASAQMTGQYRGVSTQGQVVEFLLSIQAGQFCVQQVGFTVYLTCPSGAQPGWQSTFFPCSSVQEDGSFAVNNVPVDGALLGYVVTGQFTSDTTVEGGINFNASHLHVEGGKIVEAQLCGSPGVTFTASRVGGASEPPKFEGNEIIRTADRPTGNTSTLYRLDVK